MSLPHHITFSIAHRVHPSKPLISGSNSIASPLLILPSLFKTLSYLPSCRKLLYLSIPIIVNSLAKPSVYSHADRLRPRSDTTHYSSRPSRSPQSPVRIPSRSNPTTPPTLERYLREDEPYQAFLGRLDPMSPSGSQMPSYSRSYYGSQAPSYQNVSGPYQPPSREHDGNSSQLFAITEYPPPDDHWRLPQYPAQYHDETPTPYSYSPTPTHYTHSQSSQAPPPYETHSRRHSVAPHGILDDPHRPPTYDVSMRSQGMFQYRDDWDSQWQRTEQAQDDSSSDDDRRYRRGERRRSNNEHRSNNDERRRRDN